MDAEHESSAEQATALGSRRGEPPGSKIMAGFFGYAADTSGQR